MSQTSIPLTLTGLSSNLCFEGSFADAIKTILNQVRVLVPDDITNVVIGPEQPDDSQRDSVWFRLDSGGNYEGIFIYAAGGWQQVSPVPNELPWVYGDSNNPPAGYIPANSADSPLSSGEKTYLESLWYPLGPGPWSMYQVVFVGF